MGHHELTEQIKMVKKTIESGMTTEQKQTIRELFSMMELQNYAESKYLYIHGLTGGADVRNHLDTEFINPLYINFKTGTAEGAIKGDNT